MRIAIANHPAPALAWEDEPQPLAAAVAAAVTTASAAGAAMAAMPPRPINQSIDDDLAGLMMAAATDAVQARVNTAATTTTTATTTTATATANNSSSSISNKALTDSEGCLDSTHNVPGTSNGDSRGSTTPEPDDFSCCDGSVGANHGGGGGGARPPPTPVAKSPTAPTPLAPATPPGTPVSFSRCKAPAALGSSGDDLATIVGGSNINISSNSTPSASAVTKAAATATATATATAATAAAAAAHRNCRDSAPQLCPPASIDDGLDAFEPVSLGGKGSNSSNAVNHNSSTGSRGRSVGGGMTATATPFYPGMAAMMAGPYPHASTPPPPAQRQSYAATAATTTITTTTTATTAADQPEMMIARPRSAVNGTAGLFPLSGSNSGSNTANNSNGINAASARTTSLVARPRSSGGLFRPTGPAAPLPAGVHHSATTTAIATPVSVVRHNPYGYPNGHVASSLPLQQQQHHHLPGVTATAGGGSTLDPDASPWRPPWMEAAAAHAHPIYIVGGGGGGGSSGRQPSLPLQHQRHSSCGPSALGASPLAGSFISGSVDDSFSGPHSRHNPNNGHVGIGRQQQLWLPLLLRPPPPPTAAAAAAAGLTLCVRNNPYTGAPDYLQSPLRGYSGIGVIGGVGSGPTSATATAAPPAALHRPVSGLQSPASPMRKSHTAPLRGNGTGSVNGGGRGGSSRYSFGGSAAPVSAPASHYKDPLQRIAERRRLERSAAHAHTNTATSGVNATAVASANVGLASPLEDGSDSSSFFGRGASPSLGSGSPTPASAGSFAAGRVRAPVSLDAQLDC